MRHYQIKKKAVYEILDTEAIIINFNTGDYYTLPCLAKQIWQMLEKNASGEMMVEAFVNYYHCDPEKAYNEIELFLHQLCTEGLLEHIPSPLACNYPLSDILGADAQYKWEYYVPVVHKYSDIGNLLLLDPIHDVDTSGWPNQATEKESNPLKESNPVSG